MQKKWGSPTSFFHKTRLFGAKFFGNLQYWKHVKLCSVIYGFTESKNVNQGDIWCLVFDHNVIIIILVVIRKCKLNTQKNYSQISNWVYSVKWAFRKSFIFKFESFFWPGSHIDISMKLCIQTLNIMWIKIIKEKFWVTELNFAAFWQKHQNKQKTGFFGFESKIVSTLTKCCQ